MPTYKFPQGSKVNVNIRFPNKKAGGAAASKGIIADDLRDEVFGRRVSGAYINFYDLAQIKSGDSYIDHPILKSPSYSASPAINVTFQGAEYFIEQFDAEDYQNFIDSLFEIAPVEEWKNNFRRLNEVKPYPGFDYEMPTNLKMRKLPHSGSFLTEPVFLTHDIDFYGWDWTTNGAKYKNFQEISLTGNISKEWFRQSTKRGQVFGFKITDEYDPDAPDVSGLSISGNVDVYLIPQIGLFFAAASHDAAPSATTGFDVMFAYQVMPRQHFPYYLNFDVGDVPALQEEFLNYQKGRDGMVASSWNRNGVTNTITETSIPASSFSFPYEYKAFIDNSDNQTLFSIPGRTLRTATDLTRMIAPSPLLVGVMKIRNHFYYIFAVPDEEGLTSADVDINNVTDYIIQSAGY